MAGKYKHQGTVSDDEGVYDVTSLGHGLKIKKRRKLNFTREEATKLLELDEFVGDRALKQNHVDNLVRAMLRGTFHPEWVTLIICSLNGNTYRMNGQHTSWARLEMPPNWKCEVELIEYEAVSEEDVRTLYSSIDRSSPRTRANVMDSYLAGTEEFKSVKAQTLRVVPAGLTLWFWSGAQERRRHDADDVAYLLKTDHYDLTIKVCAFLDRLSPREHRHIFRSPVVAALYATFNKAPQIATDFWNPVADGTGIEKKGDPRLKLRNILMQTAVESGGGARSNKQSVSQELMYRMCIAAWNASREGRSLQILRANERGKRPGIK